MRLPPRSSRSLTASAARVTNAEATAQYGLRIAMPWQQRSLLYVVTIPELQYASKFYARMLQKIRIYPAFRLDDDKTEPITEGLPVELLNRIQDPGGGRSQIQYRYGQLHFITGESYLFGRNLGEKGKEKWSVVWREELKFDGNGLVTHMAAPQLPRNTLKLTDAHYVELPTNTAVAYRMWTPSARFSDWPSAPMEAVMEMSEELMILSRSVHATATARLVKSKILMIPSQIEPPPLDTTGDEDPAQSPFLQDLLDHVNNVMEDPGSPESLSPFLFFADGEYLAMVREISLHDTATDYMEKDLRKECVQRIGRGLDLPPEVIDGMTGANHWAAWWISDDMWRSHGAPIAEQFCDDLSESYLRPALEAEGFERWDEVVIGFDASAVIVNPDRSKDADQAMGYGQISGFGYRVLKNIPEEYKPSEEERAEYLAMKMPAVKDDTNPGDEPGQPDGEPGEVSEGTNLPASAFQGAAELALYRCRELAGSRIRSRRKSCPGCLDEVQHIENSMVASALGSEGLVPLGSPSPADLVLGGADSFKSMLVSWGNREEDAHTVAKMLEMHAARTLFHERTRVPSSLEIG